VKLVPTRRVENAIRVLKFLMSTESNSSSAASIASATGLSAPVVRQLMQTLARAGLVGSQSGPRGGYWLSCVPVETTMRTVTEACEGPINPQFCDLRGIACEQVPQCALHLVWSDSQAMLADELARFTLSDLAAPATP